MNSSYYFIERSK